MEWVLSATLGPKLHQQHFTRPGKASTPTIFKLYIHHKSFIQVWRYQYKINHSTSYQGRINVRVESRVKVLSSAHTHNKASTTMINAKGWQFWCFSANWRKSWLCMQTKLWNSLVFLLCSLWVKCLDALVNMMHYLSFTSIIFGH